MLQVPLVSDLKRIFSAPMFGSSVTWGQLILTLVLTVLILWLTRRLVRRYLERGLRARGIKPASAQAAATLTYYGLVALGILVALQTTGVDLSSLAVLGGALGVGIGFGLQNVVGNFVSGLVLLLEQPVKVGDRIEIGGLLGTVRRIGGRATTVVTNDDIAIIVPNNDFVTQRVTNWSFTGGSVRIVVPVGVSYQSDPRVVRDTLLEVARNHEGVADKPQPDVIFTEFGDSALLFELRIWTSAFISTPKLLASALNFAIWDALAAKGIEIPFPQRDLHVRSGSLVIETRPAAPEA